MGQDSYIQKISPIDIPRKRRQQPKESLSSAETQSLRQICGSLQYAAVHTRPDISAKVGELQAAIPCGRVEHLILANRVLFEAKSKPVNLMIVPIAESKVTFCAFSDASFESGNGNPTRQGTLIFTTDGNLAKKSANSDLSDGMVLTQGSKGCAEHTQCRICGIGIHVGSFKLVESVLGMVKEPWDRLVSARSGFEKSPTCHSGNRLQVGL